MALVFVLGHFLAVSLIIATAMFFLVGRVLGKRRQGLFGPPVGGEDGLEFGYCFDVSCVLSTNAVCLNVFTDTCRLLNERSYRSGSSSTSCSSS